MTKIDIFSGFLGAGKTTLIKKLIHEAYAGEQVVLIENEFGEIGVDGGFLKDAGIQITEMNSGCICCSLVGDFSRSLAEVLEKFHPDRILIEPSGVGKLSDVIRAVQGVLQEDVVLNGVTTVVDAGKCKMYRKNFGEFFCDQIAHAHTIVLSHTTNIGEEKIAACLSLLRELNDRATIVTTAWDALSGAQLLAAVEQKNTLADELHQMQEEHHHHHHDDDDEECCHHHHHDDDEECCHHHHHDDDEECCHHHHHDDDEGCCHGHHHEGGHHHHHADEVFDSFGVETAKKYTADEIRAALRAFADGTEYGMVLRAKGIVAGEDGHWIHFDYVPGEADVRTGAADVTGRLCVIGAGLHKEKIAALFGLS